MIYPMEGIDETQRMEIEARSELMATMNRLVLQKGVSVGVINQVALDMIITGYQNQLGSQAYSAMFDKIYHRLRPSKKRWYKAMMDHVRTK